MTIELKPTYSEEETESNKLLLCIDIAQYLCQEYGRCQEIGEVLDNLEWEYERKYGKRID